MSQHGETNRHCLLCGNADSVAYHRDRRREYFQCRRCHLVFVPPEYFLSAEEEKARYDLHRNDPEDAGYRGFLGKLFDPVAARITPGATGLDFGCGPGPALSPMFQQAGFACANYDPFYAANPDLLEQRYDFLTCSEVIEHCHAPMKEFQLFLHLVKPGGLIGIMTQMVRDKKAFEKWRYIDDETHVSFFSKETFQWLGRHLNIQLQFYGESVVLFSV